MSEIVTGRIDRGRGHTYLLDGHRVPGVTSILSDGVPKPALINWAGNTTSEYAVDHWDELGKEPPSKRLALLKAARYTERDAAANRGTEVHTLAEALVHGQEVDVPEPLAAHVENYVRFLDDWQPQPLLVERPVFSRKHRYAGTFDLICDFPTLGRYLVDLKTSRSGIFAETALQAAAYRHADIYLDTDGHEQPMPQVDGCAAVWCRSDGYDLIPIEAGPAVFRTFLYVAQVAQFTANGRDLIGDTLTPPRLEETA